MYILPKHNKQKHTNIQYFMFMRKPRDSNPEAAQHDHRFSRPADYQLSQTSKFNFLWAQVKLRNFLVYNEQCLRSAAPYNIFIHPSWCTLLRGVRTSFIFLEPLVGLEPTTSSLQVRCNYQLCYRGSLIYIPIINITQYKKISNNNKKCFPNNAPMELPNGLLPIIYHKRLKVSGLETSYYKPFFAIILN